MYLLMLDGGWEFTARLNGQPLAPLRCGRASTSAGRSASPSFSYEQPARLRKQSGDLFMCCSDFPHSEGTATPIDDYEAVGEGPAEDPALFHDNAAFLLGDGAVSR